MAEVKRATTELCRRMMPRKAVYERIIGEKNSFEEEITVWRKLYKNYSRAYLFIKKSPAKCRIGIFQANTVRFT